MAHEQLKEYGGKVLDCHVKAWKSGELGELLESARHVQDYFCVADLKNREWIREAAKVT
jgi:hypothetical protein